MLFGAKSDLSVWSEQICQQWCLDLYCGDTNTLSAGPFPPSWQTLKTKRLKTRTLILQISTIVIARIEGLSLAVNPGFNRNKVRGVAWNRAFDEDVILEHDTFRS